MQKKWFIALILLSTWIMVNAYVELKGAIDTNDSGLLQLSSSDNGRINGISSLESYQIPPGTNDNGNVTLYGGEHILVIPRSDSTVLKEEAQKRLGELGEFKRYLIAGSEILYLDVNEKTLEVDQNENSALLLLASNDDEMRKGMGNYPHSIILDSNKKMSIGDIIEVLFDGRAHFVYIPRDYNPYDNEPVPKIIVEKQKGVAVQYIKADGFNYLAFGFGQNAESNMQEMIKRNGVYGGGGGSMRSGVGPVYPAPELNPFILTSIGLTGLFLVLRKYKRN